MNYHDELRQMRESVARRERTSFVPDSYGFEGRTVEHVREALDKARDEDPRIVVALGIDADGNPEAWLVVKARGEVLYAGDFSYTCPPRPPEECI
jgi:hypothetical protein